MKTTKHVLLTVMALALYSICCASEKVVIIRGFDLSRIQNMLDDGWTVKSSYAAVRQSSHGYHQETDVFHVFTLVAPSDLSEREAKRAAEAKAAFEKKRAEWFAKKPKIEKP